ncbi:MAG TPA: hypothetical protein VFX76_00410, partial [Roseiflexaceae bacterium]|nr:hypothetical protein [Roseiflexaceae bacterium]
MASVEDQIATALEWWRVRLPAARLTFELKSLTVPTRYEPIAHNLSGEGLWISDAMGRLGYNGHGYFDQVYAADEAIRRAHKADWATTVFMVNSANDDDGRFADNMFAYAYIGGPFMVLTSDTGLYGTHQMAPVAAHELGHIFGALDQYASAAVPCTQLSGYLGIAPTNSQFNGCGTHLPSIMLDPVSAFAGSQIDDAALAQVGYRDSDSDGLPDPLDTTPQLTLTVDQLASGRPTVSGQAVDQPFPSTLAQPATINTIARVEYRVNGGAWWALPAQDGAFDNAIEALAAPLPLYDGQHSVDFRAVNSRGALSTVLSRSVTVAGVGVQPAYAVDATRFTNSTAITLTLQAPAGSMAQVSEDPLFANAQWRLATAISNWQLGAVDGTHSLYVRFRDAAGIESPPFVQTVVFDRTAPSGTALLHGTEQPWLELLAQDSGSGVVAVQLNTDALTDEWHSFQHAMSLPEGAKDVTVRFRDAAGNISDPIKAQGG